MEEQEIIENLSVNNPDTIIVKDAKNDIIFSDEPDDDFSVETLFNNSAKNSRTPVRLGKNLWTLKWKAQLEEELSPEKILFYKDRIIVYSDGFWQLFDINGKPLTSGALGFSEIYIDKTKDLFYFSDYNGLVQARNLSDGLHKFSMFAMYGDNYYRAMFHRSESLLYILSVEYTEDPHGHHFRNSSVLEVLDFGKEFSIDPNGFLTSSERLNTISLRSINADAAFEKNNWVIAVPDHIIIADKNLEIKTVLKTKFIPRTLSLDNNERIYLIVTLKDETGNNINALWILNFKGERLANITLPERRIEKFYPPVLGYKSGIFIPYGNYILTFNTESKSLSEKIIEMPFGGACISAEDKLIIASGKMIFTISDTEEMSLIANLENDTWQTNPVFTDSDHVICASEQSLYCFERGQKLN